MPPILALLIVGVLTPGCSHGPASAPAAAPHPATLSPGRGENFHQGGTGYLVGRQYPCGPASTLAEAEADHEFAIYLPEHPLANRANLKGVSDCPSEVIIYFDSGVAVYIEQESSPPNDPAAFWQKLADQEPPGTATVGIVRGEPALIIDVAAEPPGEASYLGGVSLFEAGLHIDVAGNGEIPASDLIAVAETLQPDKPPGSPGSSS